MSLVVHEHVFHEGEAVIVNWGHGEYHRGRILEVRTELTGRSRAEKVIQLLRVQYTDGQVLWHDPRCTDEEGFYREVQLADGDDVDGDAELQITQSVWEQLPLRCSISFQPLTDPALSEPSLCTHAARCNYEPLRQYVASHKVCPWMGCNQRLRFSSIKRNDALRDALATLPVGTETCWLRGVSDVQLKRPSQEGPNTTPAIKSKACATPIDVDDDPEGQLVCASEQAPPSEARFDEMAAAFTRQLEAALASERCKAEQKLEAALESERCNAEQKLEAERQGVEQRFAVCEKKAIERDATLRSQLDVFERRHDDVMARMVALETKQEQLEKTLAETRQGLSVASSALRSTLRAHSDMLQTMKGSIDQQCESYNTFSSALCAHAGMLQTMKGSIDQQCESYNTFSSALCAHAGMLQVMECRLAQCHCQPSALSSECLPAESWQEAAATMEMPGEESAAVKAIKQAAAGAQVAERQHQAALLATSLPAPSSDESHKLYTIDRLIGKKVEKSRRRSIGSKRKRELIYYKVLWEGYPPEMATWEPEAEIHREVIDEYEASPV
jgi:hypothetical protein